MHEETLVGAPGGSEASSASIQPSHRLDQHRVPCRRILPLRGVHLLPLAFRLSARTADWVSSLGSEGFKLDAPRRSLSALSPPLWLKQLPRRAPVPVGFCDVLQKSSLSLDEFLPMPAISKHVIQVVHSTTPVVSAAEERPHCITPVNCEHPFRSIRRRYHSVSLASSLSPLVHGPFVPSRVLSCPAGSTIYKRAPTTELNGGDEHERGTEKVRAARLLSTRR